MMIIEIPKNAICTFQDCDKPATAIACGRSDYQKPNVFCEEHAYEVADEQYPEYHDNCPNCGCEFGINQLRRTIEMTWAKTGKGQVKGKETTF